MNEYISNEIAKNIKGMSETLGFDDSKYWYFAGKVEALSLLKKEMENRSIILSVKDTKFDIDEWKKNSKCGIIVGDKFEYVDTDSVHKSNVPLVKDTRSIKQRFNEMFGLGG